MKALAMLSGGLDSTLAIKVILDQGVEVEAINFFTPFCLCNRKNGCGSIAKRVSDTLGVKLKVFNLSDEYFKMIQNPIYGYGKNLNPCIDCRIFMHRRAKEYMKEAGASFVITGEVLGQRPMSQHREALKIIERESSLEGFVLRPLSAKLLPLTIPEMNGLVDRKGLLEISGRSRKPQMALAKDYKINDCPCPAGGCLLTDPGFSRRMRDLMKYSEVTVGEIELLKVGRHFRLSPTSKMVVGRNEKENRRLARLVKEGDILFEPTEGVNGPLGLGRGELSKEEIQKGAGLVTRYCDRTENEKVIVVTRKLPAGRVHPIKVNGMLDEMVEAFRI